MSALGKLNARHDIQRGLPVRSSPVAQWGFELIAGRLTELSAKNAGASLSVTAALIREVQSKQEHAVWIGPTGTTFHAEDFDAAGIDLAQLPVIQLPDIEALPIAADLLIRSGAFALIILDLEAVPFGAGRSERAGRSDGVGLRLHFQTRLMGLARKHGTALVCLTCKSRQSASLSSLVSVRVEASHRRLADGRFACEVEVIRDKRSGAFHQEGTACQQGQNLGLRHTELRRGPTGLC